MKEKSRGKGIGKELIKACEEWAAKQGINTMLVNSGNRANRKAAHLFYGKMGYQIKSSGFVKEL